MRAAVLVGLAGCTSIFGLESPQRGRDAALIDADVADGPDAAPDAPLGPWGNVTQVIVSAVADDDVSLTDDMLEMYFNRENEIYVVKRASVAAAWGQPTIVTELVSAGNEARPEVSGDGLLMLFSSSRAPSMGLDLWSTQRTSRTGAWQTPVQFMMINSAADEVAGPVTEDKLELVYAADRVTNDEFDLYYADRLPGANQFFDQGVPLSFNSTASETSPFLTRDGKHLYFARLGSTTTMADLYVSHRLSATEWSAPEPITELNTATPDSDPWVSPDERHMFFATFAGGRFQIHEASR